MNIFREAYALTFLGQFSIKFSIKFLFEIFYKILYRFIENFLNRPANPLPSENILTAR